MFRWLKSSGRRAAQTRTSACLDLGGIRRPAESASPHSLSIDELIAAAEISKSGFFYHFADKNELAKALLERYLTRDDEILDEIFSPRPTPSTTIRCTAFWSG